VSLGLSGFWEVQHPSQSAPKLKSLGAFLFRCVQLFLCTFCELQGDGCTSAKAEKAKTRLRGLPAGLVDQPFYGWVAIG